MLKQMQERRGSDEGFTLIELLIAIVVIGVLSAVVIVGIGGLTNSGKTGACKASQDAVRAGIAVHYANTTPNAYPATVQLMVTNRELELSGGTTITPVGGAVLLETVVGSGWSFTYAPAVAPAAPVLGACTFP